MSHLRPTNTTCKVRRIEETKQRRGEKKTKKTNKRDIETKCYTIIKLHIFSAAHMEVSVLSSLCHPSSNRHIIAIFILALFLLITRRSHFSPLLQDILDLCSVKMQNVCLYKGL